jgi:hypothetical protein
MRLRAGVGIGDERRCGAHVIGEQPTVLSYSSSSKELPSTLVSALRLKFCRNSARAEAQGTCRLIQMLPLGSEISKAICAPHPVAAAALPREGSLRTLRVASHGFTRRAVFSFDDRARYW